MPPTPPRSHAAAFLSLLGRLGPLLALLLLIALATALDQNGSFLSVQNFTNILRQNSFVGIIALGMTAIIVLGGIDLSVGSMVALVGGVGILAMNKAGAAGFSTAASICVGAATMLLLGSALGAFNGFVVAAGRIPPFIATLGGMAIFRSLSLLFANGGEYRASVPGFEKIGGASWTLPISYTPAGADAAVKLVDLRFDLPTCVFLGLAVVLSIVMSRTTYGRHVHAIGDNEHAAHYAGIHLGRMRVATYALMGLLCAVAALLVSSRMNSVSSAQTGSMYELDAIAAVVVGGASMRGGRGGMWGTVVGVLILGVINNMLNMISSTETLKRLGMEGINIAHLQGLVKGLIVIAAVLVQRGRTA